MLKSFIAGRPLLRLRLAVQRTSSRFSSSSSSSKPTIARQAIPQNAPGNTASPPQRLSWAYLYPFGAPFRAYSRMQDRSPYLTQVLASTTIFFLGDLSAQLVASSPPAVTGSDDSSSAQGPDAGPAQQQQQYMYYPERGLRAMLIGAIAALPSYHWFLFLGRHFNYGSHILSLCVKIVVNQAVFTPCLNTFFFGMHSLLSGANGAETIERLKETVPRSCVMSCRVWPLVTAVNFTFVAPRDRSVAAGVVAIGWQTYLSWLNSQAAAKAKEVVATGES